jgi:hypothetical protein
MGTETALLELPTELADRLEAYAKAHGITVAEAFDRAVWSASWRRAAALIVLRATEPLSQLPGQPHAIVGQCPKSFAWRGTSRCGCPKENRDETR